MKEDIHMKYQNREKIYQMQSPSENQLQRYALILSSTILV